MRTAKSVVDDFIVRAEDSLLPETFVARDVGKQRALAPHRHLPASLHRLNGICHQVDQHLLDSIAVAFDDRGNGFVFAADACVSDDLAADTPR